LQQQRFFAAQAAPTPDPSNDTSSIGNEKVQKLAEELLNLTVLESSWLTEILRKKLNLQKPAYGAMPAVGFAPPMAGQMAAPAAASPAAAAPPAPAEAKKEKADFDVKLESFSADGKIKVIKEIRAITNLGLKEAKELVSDA
jgi:large subunit ribosomal protein L7/L12